MSEPSPQKQRWGILFGNPRFLLGISFVILTLVMALLAPYISPYEIDDGDFTNRLCAPSGDHWLGCDVNGADILTIMLWGARTSLYVGFLTVALSVFVGVGVGLVSGYYGGAIDGILMRIVDIFMAFPGILLAMCLTALLGPSLNTVIFAISATGWTSAARLVRGQVLSIREREFVLASQAFGAQATRLMLKHILPHTLTPLIVHGTFSLSGVIIVEAGLSYLGLGAQDSTLTWGALLGQSSEIELSQGLHLTLIPGAAIFMLVMSLNFIGDALRDVLDPKSLRELN
ncbi:ABC transporter permease [Pseudobacteriovorax antillogorgiicola]|uniref:Peptide/nickel transport system permease protein n=1 Tax=Pseudobacteriovorax antillogorgiicola TaxID=1513793 RepID=A0A1Y6B8U3_9BACT|nr:ABC transporter permease [Pseudobacteriovorax antillogorgiicola]TCS59502.1 peptide/nickel transport system permease protein [Pseudobacteriovorax antillogorgiicola]SME87900.1 peptide/nickel transport system permease protein [Pseudobacteriovorax antillogorgiicola]